MIKLRDDVLIEAKAIAARTGRTVEEVVEDALRESFARRRGAGRTGDQSLPPPFGEGGLRPGVDLDGSAALLDIMDPTVR